jgi:hypothetical protein
VVGFKGAYHAILGRPCYEKLVNEDLDSTAKHASSFEAAEQTKEVPLDPAAAEGKVLRVSSTLDPK